MDPRLKYVVCATPRTGTTLLCRGLTKTRLAGCPDEYLDYRKWWIDRHGDYQTIENSMITNNGVYGLKIFWFQFKKFEGSFDFDKYIFVRRANKIAQAISYYRADKTGKWRSHDPQTGSEPPYDYKILRHWVKFLTTEDNAWKEYFGSRNISPLEVWYERDLMAAQDYAPTIRKTLEFLGLPADIHIPSPFMQSQTDGISFGWEQRYLEDKYYHEDILSHSLPG